MSLTTLLQLEEGLSLKAVKDSVGYVIGYGRNVMTRGVSQKESDYLLANDVDAAAILVKAAFPWSVNLDSARRGVLEAMSYQMGIGGILTFKKMLVALKAGAYSTAATEMLDSTFAHQTPERANRLARQLRTGRWVYPGQTAPRKPFASKGVRYVPRRRK